MKRTWKHNVGSCGVALLTLVVAGCSSTAVNNKTIERKTYTVAYRPYAPEPVYNRLRWVYSPDHLPSKDIATPKSDKGSMAPVVHYRVKNAPLPEAIMILADVLRYSGECPDSLASVRVTLNTLGTADELASEISRVSGEQVVIDHRERVVRIASSVDAPPAPELYRDGGLDQSAAPGAIEGEKTAG